MSIIFTLIGYLGFVSCLIWSLVEFILYLFKDKEYNFWSLYLLPIFLIIMIISFIKTIMNKKEDNLFKLTKIKFKPTNYDTNSKIK